MKYNLLLSFIVLATFFASCTEDVIETVVEESVPAIPNDGTFSYSLQFDVAYPHYGGDSGTRATDSGEWEDGDVVYITFSNGESPAIGKAVYSVATNSWSLYSPKRLVDGISQSCRVMYLCCEDGSSESIHIDSDNYCVSDTPLSKAFRCDDGKYDVENGKVTVSAHLVPIGKRLRFKGAITGTKIIIHGEGLYSICGYSLKDNDVKSIDSSHKMTVKEDGYTDYVLININEKCCQIILELDSDDKISCFAKYFDGNTLLEGESGCLSVPSLSSLYGWNFLYSHEYVDLGLPSGTKWATCNIGAENPEDHGLHFAWGETIGYLDGQRSFDWESYKWCLGTQKTLIKYNSDSEYGLVDFKKSLDIEDDAAYELWGKSWRIPTSDEVGELIRNCDLSRSTINNVEGYRVSSRIDKSKYVFFSYGGCVNSRQQFWTSSTTSYPCSAYIITAQDGYGVSDGSFASFCSGLVIRPVILK